MKVDVGGDSDVVLRFDGLQHHVWHLHRAVLERAAGTSEARSPAGAEETCNPVEIVCEWPSKLESHAQSRATTVCALLEVVYFCGQQSAKRRHHEAPFVTQALRKLSTCSGSPYEAMHAFLRAILSKLHLPLEATVVREPKLQHPTELEQEAQVEVEATIAEEAAVKNRSRSRSRSESAPCIVQEAQLNEGKALDRDVLNVVQQSVAGLCNALEILRWLQGDKEKELHTKVTRLSKMLQVKLEDNLKVVYQLEKAVERNRTLAIKKHKKRNKHHQKARLETPKKPFY